MERNQPRKNTAHRHSTWRSTAGFTLLEMVIVVAVGVVLTAIAIPVVSTAMTNMRINSAVSQFSGALSSARYQAIKDSKAYTFVLTAPANTYVVPNTPYLTQGALSPLVAINGGSGVFTYTLCPNGMVYGAGALCPTPGASPPALSFTYQGRQINVSVSNVGNVSTTIIH